MSARFLAVPVSSAKVTACNVADSHSRSRSFDSGCIGAECDDRARLGSAELSARRQLRPAQECPCGLVAAVVVALLAALPAAAQNGNTVPRAGRRSQVRCATRQIPQASRPGRGRDKASRDRAAAAGASRRPACRRHPTGGRRRHHPRGRRSRAKTRTDAVRDLLAIPPCRPPSALAIQFDLAWTGDYNGLINGEVSDKTTAAIKAFQRNRKFKETGVLNPQERALLAAAAKAKQAQVGWTMVDDPVTGARLGIPDQARPEQDARARPAPAGPRRKGKSRSRPSGSGSPARRSTSGLRAAEEGAVGAQARGQLCCGPTSSSCRACRA